MKILISAFSCNPYQGSEPGVGWSAVSRIALNHDVYVLADSHNLEGLTKAKDEGIMPSNVHIRFLRKKTYYFENKLLARLQSWFWFREFNKLVLNAAQDWHRNENFDLCHQVTIATWRIPSPLWKLPIPFIWGPIGGTGRIPNNFRSILSWKSRLFELLRDLSTILTLQSTAFRKCMENTAVILAANDETVTFLKPYRKDMPLIKLPIVSLAPDKIEAFKRPDTEIDASYPLQIFAGGFMIGSKGISLALQALARVKAAGVNFHYTIAGGGPEIECLKKLARQLAIEEQVSFHDGFYGDDYIRVLQKSEIYLLPSFREGTPVTLIEACLAGCFPIVADISAQGEIVRAAYGIAVPVIDIEQLITGFTEGVIRCNAMRHELRKFSEAGRQLICASVSSRNYEQSLEQAYAYSKKIH